MILTSVKWRRVLVASLAVFAVGFSSGVMADSLDSDEREALQKTKQLLKSQSLRQDAIKKGGHGARAADAAVQDAAGSPANAEKIYGLSADIFDDLVKQTGGDIDKMNAILKKAQQDPESFANSLSPAQIERLRSIANDAARKHHNVPSSR